MAVQIRMTQKVDVLSEWTLKNPILYDGEIGVVKDASPINFKIGNGVTAFNDLPYVINIDEFLTPDYDANESISLRPTTDGTLELVIGTESQKWANVEINSNILKMIASDTIEMHGYGITIENTDPLAGIYFKGISNIAQPNVLYYDPVLGKISYDTAPESSTTPKNTIAEAVTLTIEETEQYIVYNDFYVFGKVIVKGELVIMDGDIILSGNESEVLIEGNGIIKNVLVRNISSGNVGTIKETIQFTTSENMWLTINHGLDTTDILYQAYAGNQPLDMDFEIINASTIRIRTVTAITGKLIIS